MRSMSHVEKNASQIKALLLVRSVSSLKETTEGSQGFSDPRSKK